MVGNQYQAFLDDQLILTMIDDTFASGKVALYDNYLFGQSNDYVRVSPLMSTIDVRLNDFGPSGVMGYRFNGGETIYGSAANSNWIQRILWVPMRRGRSSCAWLFVSSSRKTFPRLPSLQCW